jgi:tetratricopeptide (TPR) repeat protein
MSFVFPPTRRARNLALFGLALGLRLLHLALLRRAFPELIAHPVVDAEHYHLWAQDILAGTGLAHRTFFMHPVYPHLLAVIYALVGPRPLAVALVQSVLGASSAVLLAESCERWFGTSAALVAGVLLALYEPLLLTDALLETVSLGVFLLLVAIWLLTRQSGPWSFALAGVSFMLAVLSRGNLVLCAPALFLAGWLAGRRLQLLALAGGMALVVGSVGLRNRIVGGEWVWLTSSAGQTLYLGNYAGATTGAHQPPPFLRGEPRFEETDYHAEAEREAGRPLTPAQTSRFWAGRARAEIAAHPGPAAVRVVRKLILTLGNYEIADNYNLAYLRHLTAFRWLPLPGFAWIVGLAAIGMVAAWPRRRALALVYGVAALYTGSLAVFYVSSRLRIYLVPFLIAFAANGLLWLFEARGARRWLAVGAAGTLALLSTLVTPEAVREVEWAQALNGHALALEAAGQPASAAHLRDQALALDPENPYLLVNVGLAALKAGDLPRASGACRAATVVRPSLSSAQGCLGIALAKQGQIPAAQSALERAAALDQDGPESRFNLAVLLAARGQRADARRLLEEIVRAHPEHSGAQRALRLLP